MIDERRTSKLERPTVSSDSMMERKEGEGRLCRSSSTITRISSTANGVVARTPLMSSGTPGISKIELVMVPLAAARPSITISSLVYNSARQHASSSTKNTGRMEASVTIPKPASGLEAAAAPVAAAVPIPIESRIGTKHTKISTRTRAGTQGETHP